MGKTVAAWRHVALAMILTGSTSTASAQSSDGSFMSSRRFMRRDGEVIYRTGTRQRSEAFRGRIFSAGRDQRLEGHAAIRRTSR